MATPDFVQIHMLTSYPAALLNRDDVGLAKRIPFGGSTRTRVSSQCLKKHWREAEQIGELGDLAVRSRKIYERLLLEPLQQESGASPEQAELITKYLLDLSLKSAKGDDAKGEQEGEGGGKLQTGQVVVLATSEVQFLLQEGIRALEAIRGADKEPKTVKDLKKLVSVDSKNVEALPASLDTALFGRFVTSDLFARVDAAVSLAHAFTTHSEAAETDYFTAIDMLTGDEPGAGLIQDTELTTGVFYLYAVVDMGQLRQNLVGHPEDLAVKLVRNLIEVMATVSPGAKRGSTAPYSYAEFVLLERGGAQPTTLANAFLRPVTADGAQLVQASVDALVEHQGRLQAMYDLTTQAGGIATIHSLPEGTDGMPLSEVLDETLPLDA